MFADVLTGYPLESSFTYRVPPGMDVEPGKRVKVNFARRNVTAFVIRVHDEEPSGFEIKDILEVIDSEAIFNERLVDLCRFVAYTYISSVGEALSMALPSGLKPSARYKVPFTQQETAPIALTSEQEKVFQDILLSREENSLLHCIFGITGSGKTEVYIELAKKMLEQGKSVIYLVPEISLSSQIYERLFHVFGDDLVIYHSHLTSNQRLFNWMRFYRGEARVVIGTRSAIFMQCPDLGLIIVDEEHDGSYKEHSTPRYNARRVALYRSKKEKTLVVMGSATPSLETLYAGENGIIRIHRLTRRFGGARLPEISIVKVSGGSPDKVISNPLKLDTKRAVDAGRQVIYLLNRRGFSPFVICEDCGHVIECPHCNISMNYHKGGSLLCHYCGYSAQLPAVCGKCGSRELTKLGSGTQRVEEIIEETFRGMRIFRLDQDSSRKKGSVFNLMDSMKNGEIDILVGTQMVAKGFDFPNVSLVGILMADIGLNIPDFRASERIFSLLVQVAGRSGRGSEPGKVILQTLDDEHPLFTFVRQQDYEGFYRSEMLVRKSLNYPPYTRIARLLVRGKEESDVIAAMGKLKTSIDKAVAEAGENIQVLGPAAAPMEKIGGNYRHHIIMKSRSVDMLRKVIVESRGAVNSNNVYLEIDIDPHDMM